MVYQYILQKYTIERHYNKDDNHFNQKEISINVQIIEFNIKASISQENARF